MSETQKYRTLCCKEQWLGGIFEHIALQGDALALEAGAYAGAACLPPVDSGEAGFGWRRLRLLAQVPPEAAVRVYARASDRKDWPPVGTAAGPGPDFGGPAGTVWAAHGPRPICCCRCRGGTSGWRWSWPQAGARRPRVDGLSLWMEGDHMVDYLPAIYQGQDFTYRYLSIFNTLLMGMEADIEALPRQLDPGSASDGMVDFLARWLCMEPEKGEEDLRARLPRILDEYETMYTVEGVRRTAWRLTGRKPWIIEHFAVDPNSPACRNPALYRRLYGEDPLPLFPAAAPGHL